MDSITQAALGAAVGEMMLGKRALAWGALFGTLPDLDVVFSPFLDNTADLWWHRGPAVHAKIFRVLQGASWFESVRDSNQDLSRPGHRSLAAGG